MSYTHGLSCTFGTVRRVACKCGTAAQSPLMRNECYHMTSQNIRRIRSDVRLTSEIITLQLDVSGTKVDNEDTQLVHCGYFSLLELFSVYSMSFYLSNVKTIVESGYLKGLMLRQF